MPNFNSTATTFVIAAGFALAVMSTLDWASSPRVTDQGLSMPSFQAHAQDEKSKAPEQAPRIKTWAASATGRIEPKTGSISISAETAGRVVSVPVDTGTRVKEGDLIVQLDDTDARSRVTAAANEVDVRLLERAEETVRGEVKDRYDAQDAVSDAERALFSAWRAFDEMLQEKRDGANNDTDVEKARSDVKSAKDKVKETRKALAVIMAKADKKLPSRLETSLEISRADLSLAEQAFERTRVRAPFDGSVLRKSVNEGEVVGPSARQPLMMFGDIEKLRVRAEVEERDVGKVRVGQKVVVRADAFPDQEFEGTVTLVSAALGSPRITTRGPRRPNDVDVLEVLADIDGTPPLLTGMRVDVFFKFDDERTSQTKTSNTASR